MPGKTEIEEVRQRKISRPPWDEYFMFLAVMAAFRSTCLSRAVGAVLVRGTRVISTAYNGQTPKSPHCENLGCLREKAQLGKSLDECRVVHAEQNVMTFAAKYGISTEGATLYCTHYPCYPCAKNLVSAEIKKIVYLIPYPSERTAKEFERTGAQVVSFFDLVPYKTLAVFGKRFRRFLRSTFVRMEGRLNK